MIDVLLRYCWFSPFREFRIWSRVWWTYDPTSRTMLVWTKRPNISLERNVGLNYFLEQNILFTRDLPGDTLVIAFFIHGDFSAKLQQILKRFLSQAQPATLNFKLRLQVTCCSNQLKTNTSNTGTAWSFWRGAHYLWFFNIWGAKLNKPQIKDSHISW